MSEPSSIVYNTDCMEYMKTLPDNAFDLAVVDPPYGGGFTEGGGCKGWFTKYHQDCSQFVNAERERTGSSITDLEIREADSRSTRGHYAFGMRKCRKNYQKFREDETRKKSLRGTLPQRKSISKNSFASRGIRLFGAGTTSNCRRQDAFSCGGS